MPFDVHRRDGVLILTLDTPGSPINIFNHATAHQLIGILSEVTPSTTRAVVFRTAKKNSFINGVGLLLAQAARNDDDVLRASTPPWTAYRMVREAPVPTIAVVEGNCFGCGVEFVLGCDHRLATEEWETQFYMTELNDYLFMPLFGSTWNLPETVGLSGSIDLLLWGERWDAAKAFARGLVDEIAPHEDVEVRAEDLLRRVLDGRQRSRKRGRISWGEHEDQVAQRTRRRIASLPLQYQPLYTEALTLLEAGARQTHGYLEHQKRELAQAAASALHPMGKSAYAFFYLRQMAAARAAGRPRGDAPAVTFAVDVDAGDEARPFVDDLRARRLRGVRFGDGEGYRLVSPRTAATPRSAADLGLQDVAIRTHLAAHPDTATEIYAPSYPGGGRLVELATARDGAGVPVRAPARSPTEQHFLGHKSVRTTQIRRDCFIDAEATKTLARTLQRCGFEVARTTPDDNFVTNRLLAAYLLPLLRFVDEGGAPEAVNATLRQMGFVRLPPDLLASLDRSAAAALVARALARPPAEVEPLLASLASRRDAGGDVDPSLVDGLCLSLLDAVLAARARAEIRDITIADLIARELLDFPRHLCSLGTWLKKKRVARALAAGSVSRLASDDTLAAASDFVATGREFYR